MIIKKIIFLLFPVILALAFFGCGSKSERTNDSRIPEKPQEKLIVYGSRTCPHCIVFNQKLDSTGIEYAFRDVDENDAYFRKMQQKIKTINHKDFIRFPILDIDGQMYVNPRFSQIIELLL